jgi:hypothetical protein
MKLSISAIKLDGSKIHGMNDEFYNTFVCTLLQNLPFQHIPCYNTQLVFLVATHSSCSLLQDTPGVPCCKTLHMLSSYYCRHILLQQTSDGNTQIRYYNTNRAKTHTVLQNKLCYNTILVTKQAQSQQNVCCSSHCHNTYFSTTGTSYSIVVLC